MQATFSFFLDYNTHLGAFLYPFLPRLAQVNNPQYRNIEEIYYILCHFPDTMESTLNQSRCKIYNSDTRELMITVLKSLETSSFTFSLYSNNCEFSPYVYMYSWRRKRVIYSKVLGSLSLNSKNFFYWAIL